ncbi:MAG: hypothetical protein P4L40_27065 [Terracidiphilus sp.]|nr:hypothetical protein [Terracidiphilus sp.]
MGGISAIHTSGYGYSRWCEFYRGWESRLSPTMRQIHPAGQRLFVGYAEQTVEEVDVGGGVGAAAKLSKNAG